MVLYLYVKQILRWSELAVRLKVLARVSGLVGHDAMSGLARVIKR